MKTYKLQIEEKDREISKLKEKEMKSKNIR